jgi:ribonuclease BN (tRNA processing enzyme)
MHPRLRERGSGARRHLVPGVTLTVVGPGPAYTRRPDRPSSCYLLEAEGEAIVLDLGQGSFAALAQYREPASVQAIFISHLHPDHHVDLVALRHYLKYGIDPPGSVELHAPADLRRRYDVLIGEDDFLVGLPGEPLRPGALVAGPFTVRVARVTHTDSSFGFRVAVAEEPGLVYSGDCADELDLLPLIREGDTLLSEAAFGVREDGAREAGHLSAERAAIAARDGKAGQLILTHILDDGDERGSLGRARGLFPGLVQLARPGLVVEIGGKIR